jgi:hypothetical protein
LFLELERSALCSLKILSRYLVVGFDTCSILGQLP